MVQIASHVCMVVRNARQTVVTQLVKRILLTGPYWVCCDRVPKGREQISLFLMDILPSPASIFTPPTPSAVHTPFKTPCTVTACPPPVWDIHNCVEVGIYIFWIFHNVLFGSCFVDISTDTYIPHTVVLGRALVIQQNHIVWHMCYFCSLRRSFVFGGPKVCQKSAQKVILSTGPMGTESNAEKVLTKGSSKSNAVCE